MEKTQIEELYSLPWEDKSCADPIEKARRVLGQIANRDSGYFYNDGYPRSVTIKKEVENVLKVLNTLAAAAPSDHTDDLAVDRFAAAMKAKMAASRAKGRNGWDNPDLCPVERLQGMLLDHLAKGDPVDIGNFAMMLFNRNAPVAAAAPTELKRYSPNVESDHTWDAGGVPTMEEDEAGEYVRYEDVKAQLVAAAPAEPTDAQHVALLQTALSFWLPTVQGTAEQAKRIASDAMLLFGMSHADVEKPSAGKLGWITVAPEAKQKAILLAGVQMLCVSASQEYSRCKGVIPDWDKGFFRGQLFNFDMYTDVDKSAIKEAAEYLDKLSSPPQVEPVCNTAHVPVETMTVQEVWDAMRGGKAPSKADVVEVLKDWHAIVTEADQFPR